MAPHSFADRKGTKKTADFQTTSAVFNNFFNKASSPQSRSTSAQPNLAGYSQARSVRSMMP